MWRALSHHGQPASFSRVPPVQDDAPAPLAERRAALTGRLQHGVTIGDDSTLGRGPPQRGKALPTTTPRFAGMIMKTSPVHISYLPYDQRGRLAFIMALAVVASCAQLPPPSRPASCCFPCLFLVSPGLFPPCPPPPPPPFCSRCFCYYSAFFCLGSLVLCVPEGFAF